VFSVWKRSKFYRLAEFDAIDPAENKKYLDASVEEFVAGVRSFNQAIDAAPPYYLKKKPEEKTEMNGSNKKGEESNKKNAETGEEDPAEKSIDEVELWTGADFREAVRRWDRPADYEGLSFAYVLITEWPQLLEKILNDASDASAIADPGKSVRDMPLWKIHKWLDLLVRSLHQFLPAISEV